MNASISVGPCPSRAACVALPDPPPLSVFDHVYADSTAILDAERAQYAAYLEGFDEEVAR